MERVPSRQHPRLSIEADAAAIAHFECLFAHTPLVVKSKNTQTGYALQVAIMRDKRNVEPKRARGSPRIWQVDGPTDLSSDAAERSTHFRHALGFTNVSKSTEEAHELVNPAIAPASENRPGSKLGEAQTRHSSVAVTDQLQISTTEGRAPESVRHDIRINDQLNGPHSRGPSGS
jgi:hypothetical protein